MDFALVLNAPTLSVDIKEDFIVAADGGYRHVKDKEVFAVIGDFDTLGYLPYGTKTVIHPVDKDKTDGELALDFIKENGVTVIFLGKIVAFIDLIDLLMHSFRISRKQNSLAFD